MLLVGAILLALFVLPAPWNVVAIVAGALGEAAETFIGIRWSQRRRAQVGAEALVGQLARVRRRCMPDGQVEVAGEIWRARCPEGAEVGESVRVTGRDGLILLVERSG